VQTNSLRYIGISIARSLLPFYGNELHSTRSNTLVSGDSHAATPHTERHFTAGEVVRDVVIGMSDG